jgi:hypothetical protein
MIGWKFDERSFFYSCCVPLFYMRNNMEFTPMKIDLTVGVANGGGRVDRMKNR